MAEWRDLTYITPWDRPLLANSMILSILWYWTKLMYLRVRIVKAIAENLHALVWNKSRIFRQEETGSHAVDRPWGKSQSCNLPARQGGLSLLHCHVKAIQVKS